MFCKSNNKAQKLKRTRQVLLYKVKKTKTNNLFIIHISQKLNHKNIKILMSISVIYELELWNRDVDPST